MNKDTRNTITAYLLFVYGCIFLPVFLISFKSGASEINLVTVIGFAGITSLITGVLFYNLKMKMRYRLRLLIYFTFITVVNFFLWLVICEGSFILRD